MATNKYPLKAGGTVLPSPTSLSVADEILWSSDTGRTLSGYMIGDAIAEKKTLSIKWEYLTDEDVKLIKTQLCPGWFTCEFHDSGVDFKIDSYRGTLTKEHLGYIGDGKYYYKSVSVDIVQR